jgi:hypothetical protein
MADEARACVHALLLETSGNWRMLRNHLGGRRTNAESYLGSRNVFSRGGVVKYNVGIKKPSLTRVA